MCGSKDVDGHTVLTGSRLQRGVTEVVRAEGGKVVRLEGRKEGR